jgi:uncharacterized protein YgbK (DUF1537 family)
VVGGTGLYNSTPVHLTEYGTDPTTPCRESSLLAILQENSIRAESIGLEDVRKGVKHLRSLLRASDAEAVAADAETDNDLRIIAEAMTPLRPDWFACGSSGLAPHVARAMGGGDFQHCKRPLAGHETVLAAIGSLNSASARQVRAVEERAVAHVTEVEARALCRDAPEVGRWEEAALAALDRGLRAVVTTSLSRRVPSLHDEVAPHLGALAARLAERSNATALVVSGGHTGWCTCDALGIDTLEVLGQVEPGVVCSRGNIAEGVPRLVLSKAGGFGDSGTLARLLGEDRPDDR